MLRQRKNRNMLGRKAKNNTTFKTNNTTGDNKSDGTGERRKSKKIPRLDQTKDIRGYSQTTKENPNTK